MTKRKREFVRINTGVNTRRRVGDARLVGNKNCKPEKM